ncbi:MAG: hypothetical protein ACI3W7_07145 [Oscillospiraceae bacterium]
MKTMLKTNRFLRRQAAALLLTFGVFFFTYAVVLRLCSGNSDYLLHTLWAIGMSPERILQTFYDGSERLWHIFVKLLYMLQGNMWVAAASVTAAANAAAYYLLFRITDRLLPDKISRTLTAGLLFLVFTANALCVPGQTLYVSCGAINTWHNPTNIMVRPFALAVFYMTVCIYDRRRIPGSPNAPFAFEGGFWHQFREPVYTRAELILYPVCILCSAYAKPSFLQFFAPAILIFLLIDVFRTKGMLLPFCLKLALAYLPAAVIILSQFISFFGASIVTASSAAATAAADGETAAASGIAVYFLRESFAGVGEFFSAVGRILLRILRLSAFPLFVIAIAPRAFFRDTACRLGFFGAAAGRLESMLLHETGSRSGDGNFLWGHYLAAWMLWAVAMNRFAVLVREKSTAGKLARCVGLPLLGWHTASGVLYIVRLLQSGNFYI